MRLFCRHVVPLSIMLVLPGIAQAGQTMPQFEFSNPLVISQVVWMTGIMLVLYLALSRWALPRMNDVLEQRASTIVRDLEAARTAKAEADRAVAALNATMKEARAKSQADIAKAETEAKAKALANAKTLNEKLNAQLEYSEKQIAEARNEALAAIKPVAAETAATILKRLVGQAPNQANLDSEIDAALAARKAA